MYLKAVVPYPFMSKWVVYVHILKQFGSAGLQAGFSGELFSFS